MDVWSGGAWIRAEEGDMMGEGMMEAMVHEMGVMRRILRALETLDPEAQRRIVAYLADRFGVSG